jgi:cysteine-rich repeat protein
MDDGSREPRAGRSPDCLIEICGNGILDAFEHCDNGNVEPDDGCSAQ